MSELLRTEKLTRDFGALRAVNEVDFSVKRGEVRSLIGSNGAGKSTFLDLVINKTAPTGGKVIFNGEDITGMAGLEAAEWVRGVTERLEPAAVVVVDALASRGLDRLCSAVQVADTGLIPGSGVGNHRMALTRETLGVPVLSVGVPTVVDAETIARDLLSEAGAADLDPQVLGGRGRRLFVTPDSIDARVRELGKVLGYGLDLALQPGLTVEDLEALLS